MIPQLRVRTEYSFRSCYGPVARVAERLEALGNPAAGIVDTHGTWGHVDWEKHVENPLFGTEFSIDKRRCWVLATDLAAFYRMSSSPPQTQEAMAHAEGVVRFAGAALTDPGAFDYVDINPRSRMRTRHALELADATGKPLVITSDNDYPALEDRHRFLAWDDSSKMTPQHILSDDELRAELSWIGSDLLERAIANTHEVAERCAGLKLRSAPMISFDGDLRAMVEEGRKKRISSGHIPEWTDEYQQRLTRELDMIEHKAYESYFMIVADLVVWAKERMLVGPARGSSAGSLVCYLLRITEVDPLVHGLLFERFIDVNRDDLPDIDIDFNDQKRGLVFEYLRERYGEDCVARIGSINRLKPRSVIAHVGKKLGIPHGAAFNVTNVLIEHSSGDARFGHSLQDTLTETNPGKQFLVDYPEAELMQELEEHASHTGQHAAGIIVSNVPVIEYCTVRDGIAQIDKKAAEYLNLLKIDALGLRTLGVIEDAGCVDQETLLSVTLDDPAVFSIFNDAKFSGVFQFEGAAQRRVSIQIPVEAFRQIDHITALARPGPLGGGAAQRYIDRNDGKEETTYIHPSMEEYLADTHGVVLYQEQVMRIVREIGQFSWEETSVIRKAMSGRKGQEFFDRHGDKFVAGAQEKGISESDARQIWDNICSFGAWGMNKSHTVSYAMISYWCAYMKAHHPLEYAAACLRNAKDDEQTVEILRELIAEGVPFLPFDADHSMQNWTVANGKLLGGFQNLVGIGPAKSAYYVQKREKEGLDEKDRAKLAKHKPKHDDLSPAHTLWGDIYENPGSYNIHGRVRQFSEMEDGEDAVVICKLLKIDRRDENEAVRANKRGYLKKGQTLFLDAFVVDDSISKPIVMRIRPKMWHSLGERMADRAVPKQDWFLVRGRWLADFSMLVCSKIKCLTNGEMFCD